MNYLELLPQELVDYIYQIIARQIDAAHKFQKCWKKYRAPKIVAAQLRDSVYEDPLPGIEPGINVMNPSTSAVIVYAAKVLSGREEKHEWVLFLSRVAHGLWEDQYTGGPGARYYNRSEIALEVLKTKFNVPHDTW